MAKVTAKRTGLFLREIMTLLEDKEEGMSAKDVLQHLGDKFQLTEYEKGSYASTPNEPRYTKIVRFATIDLVKAGWLVKSKGKWFITEEGKKAFAKYTDPEVFYNTAQKLYRKWKRESLAEVSSVEINEQDEVRNVTVTFEEAEENSWEQIRNHLYILDPYEFQDLVGDLLIAMGYYVAWIAPPGKDRGVDLIAFTDPLGTSNPRIKVQVKHKDGTTPVADMRAFLSVLGNDDVGIFVSSGGFTKDTMEEARAQESRKVTLLNLETFFDLWVQYYEKLSQDARQKLPLKPIYFLAPEE
jgi:restriction system protein